jgi:hypothetical protein
MVGNGSQSRCGSFTGATPQAAFMAFLASEHPAELPEQTSLVDVSIDVAVPVGIGA